MMISSFCQERTYLEGMSYQTRRHKIYCVLFDIEDDTAVGEEVIDESSEDNDARAVFAGLKNFLEESAVGQYVQSNSTEYLDLRIIEWKFPHLVFFARWLKLWQPSMEISDIRSYNMDIQVVEGINRFRYEFNENEEKIKVLVTVTVSDNNARDKLAKNW